jgi:hypothetical protein
MTAASLFLCINEPRMAQHDASTMLTKAIGTGSELGQPLCKATVSILGPTVYVTAAAK